MNIFWQMEIILWWKRTVRSDSVQSGWIRKPELLRESQWMITALVATTSYATNAKEGCENEFAIFVETDPDLYLPNLSEYITFKKEEEINVIDISDCAEILSAMKDRIKNVEVYYNPYTTKLVSVIEEAKIYNIVTQKEV